MRHLVIAALSLCVAACAGKVDYIRPTASVSPSFNVKTVERSRDAVWNASVPELGKQFFVINNLDKSSGLMNISYTGDPERYIDCGRITSYVKNARGERTYDFAGAKAQQTAYSAAFGHPVHGDPATCSTMIRPGQSERSDARFSG